MRLGEAANECGSYFYRLSVFGLSLGSRGIPRGRVIEIFGPESSGKNYRGTKLHRSSSERAEAWQHLLMRNML